MPEALLAEPRAASPVPVTDADIEIFYLVHRARFVRPETRTLRHILITINEEMRGSERPAAAARIAAIGAELARDPRRFAELAARHSECPTALNGGLLGEVPRGQLYPELEPVAFALEPGEISAVAESPMGFHFIFCEAVSAEYLVPLETAREKIRAHLTAVRRRAQAGGRSPI